MKPSPPDWPHHSWRRLTVLLLAAAPLAAQVHHTMFPPVRGTHEMVGAANNLEVEAGYRMLTQGGNAIDAGVATVLTASVTEQSRFGLGGEIPILVKPDGKPVIAISGIGVAPAKATVEFYKNRKAELWEDESHLSPIPAVGILAAPVPGAFDGLILALSRYGTMSFAQVAAPAVEHTAGFPIAEEFAAFIRGNQRFLELWPASKDFFLPGGVAPERAEIFREPTLARTLRALIAVEKNTAGNRVTKLRAVRDYFYKGALARRVAAFSEHNGGLIAYRDLANFHAETDRPRSTVYRDYEVFKPGFWTQGPVMLEALNLLEGFDLRGMGHNSPEYLHTVVEAVKLAFADRDRYYGDPKFSQYPGRDSAFERLRGRAPQADRSGPRFDGASARQLRKPAAHGQDGNGERVPRARHHLRQRGGSPWQRVFGHAQRRMAALRDRRRYWHSVQYPHADLRAHARPPQPACAGQAAPRHAQPDHRVERWKTVPRALDSRRR